uniref:Uncharacterized protein n=1 Tax=Cannabis sativa TaxID=3483 RepID=A0A803QHS3_CANSA
MLCMCRRVLWDLQCNPWLARLGSPSVLGLDDVLEQSPILEIFDSKPLKTRWVLPASALSSKPFDKVITIDLVGGVWCKIPCKNCSAHRPPLDWLAWSGRHIEHGAVLSLHHYFLDVATYFGMCLTQLMPKSIKYLSVMFVLYRELGWPPPTPYVIGYYFELKSGSKQSRSDYFYSSHVGHHWLGDTNFKALF